MVIRAFVAQGFGNLAKLKASRIYKVLNPQFDSRFRVFGFGVFPLILTVLSWGGGGAFRVFGGTPGSTVQRKP